MILSVDVFYRDTEAFIAGITFYRWEDEKESEIYNSILKDIDEYMPGQFYRRELPCILKLIEEHKIKPETIVIDGFVYLDENYKTGLGKHLYEALNRKVNVVGVAKRPYKGISAECELLRGKSKKPLYITSAGMSLEDAKVAIKSMHGKYRLPALLKKTDQVCKHIW